MPAFAFCTWAELCLRLHEAHLILTDADLVEYIPLEDHRPVRLGEAHSAARSTGVVQKIGYRLVVYDRCRITRRTPCRDHSRIPCHWAGVHFVRILW